MLVRSKPMGVVMRRCVFFGAILLVINAAYPQLQPGTTLAKIPGSGSIAASSGFNYPDFSSITGLQLAGDSKKSNNNRLRLTTANTFRAGAAWHTTKQHVQWGFATEFQFLVSRNGGDGLAFVVQNESSAALGFDGGRIGYHGITNSIAVEFDTWHNGNGDPNANHISVHTRGTEANNSDHAYSLGVTTAIPNMSDKKVHAVKIAYVSDTLKIFLDNPSAPVLAVSVNLERTLHLDNGEAWVGLTSATGGDWEIHDILSWSFTSDIPCSGLALPDTAAYGKIPGGDQLHVDEVTYCFPGQPGGLLLSFQCYDLDNNDEVDLILNGTKIFDVPATADNQWSDDLSVILPDSLVNDEGDNSLIFDNTKNPSKSWNWGVRQVSAEPCVLLPSAAAFGKIPGDDQEHPDRVVYCFAGTPGDVSLTYEVYDIDQIYELDILLNGSKVFDVAITDDNSWSETRTWVLPDTLVNDTGANALIFDNTKNPPKAWDWGVRNVSIAPGLTQKPIETEVQAALPDEFRLCQNYPNPFNPSTTIRFMIPKTTEVVLQILDPLGRVVETLIDGRFEAGIHEIKWNAAGAAGGTYFYRLRAGDRLETKKLILLK